MKRYEDNNIFVVGRAIRIEPQNLIFSYFPTQLQPIYFNEKGINVIVCRPTETVSVITEK